MDMKEKLVELPIEDAIRILRERLRHESCGYADYLAYGGKGDPAEEAYLDALSMATNALASGVTVQEWISVKDRLPEKDVRVLVWMQDNEEGYTKMDTDRWSCTMEQGYHWIRWGKSVTHWMPLPQPPKGE